MAINFLNNVNLNSIQVQDIAIENFINEAAAGGGVLGQMYFDTTRDTMMQYVANDPANPGNPGYIEIGTTSAVESLIAGAGIGISAAIGNITVRNTGLISVLDGTYIDLTKQGGGDNTQLTADLSAVDGTSVLATRFLSKDNTWDVPAFDNYNGWTLSGQSGTAQLIESGDTALFTGGTKITTAVAATDVLTITHDAQTQTDTTSTAAPGYLGTFTAVDSVARDTTGHVTGINVKTVTIPASDDTTYTLPVTAGTVSPGTPTSGIITLTDNNLVEDPVNFKGTTSRIDVSGDAGTSSIIIDLTDDVTIADNLTVSGVITQQQTGETNTFSSPLDMGGITGTPVPTKIINLATGTGPKDAVNLGQVELLVAGVGVFQGGYNATTDPGVPEISGAANVKLDLGDYFVVSHDGDITFSGTTTTGVNNGALASSTALLLTAANADVAVGMDVTGTGVPPGITIATVTDTSNFVLSSAITIANTTTLTFSDKVVSVEVGDFIFANAAIAAASDPAASEYTIVQSDANIAGAGATDGATEKGVAGFDSASFDVSASGWVQLNSQRNPYGATQTLDNTSPVSRVEANGFTTFTIDLADTTLFGAGALAKNVAAEVTQNVAPYQTVYADVTRSGTASISIVFSGSVAVDIYRVLLTHI